MLKQRIVTASILALLAIGALFGASDALWLAIIGAVAAIAAWEWSSFVAQAKRGMRFVYVAATLVMAFLALDWLIDDLWTGVVLLEMAILIAVVVRYQLTGGRSGVHSGWLILVIGALFVALFAAAMVRFREEFGAAALLLSLFTIWAMDTGAYFSGKRFGRHKLALYVSPGKTWEGVWGGMLLAAVIAAVGFMLVTSLTEQAGMPQGVENLWLFMLLSAFIAGFSVFGDLFESVLKRQVNLKDSGQLLPGHGGILDRIDSLLIAVPMFYLLWTAGVGI